MSEGTYGCTCKMNFASPEKFNALIDDSKPGVPVKGAVQVLSFLLGPFTKLTNRLTQLLMPSEADLKDRAFFEESTVLTFYTIAGAISALANTDSVSKQSALYTVDGDVSMGIKDVCYATIRVNNHTFRTIKEKAQSPGGGGGFPPSTWQTGRLTPPPPHHGSGAAGHIYMAGMISMVDNINRVLDRVAVYLG